jgi:hypothetical protein
MVVVDIAVSPQLNWLIDPDETLKALLDAFDAAPDALSRLLHAATTSLLNSQTLKLVDLELKRRTSDMILLRVKRFHPEPA